MQIQTQDDILKLATGPLAAKTLPKFLSEIRAGVEALHSFLTAPSHKSTGSAQVLLEAAIATQHSRPRYRRALELCAWPLYDKVALPPEDGQAPEVLRLFCLPVLLQFAHPAPDLVVIPSDAVPTDQLVDCLEHAKCLAEDAMVAGLTSLFSREDLQAIGPVGLASSFLAAETGDDGYLPEPLPLVFDPEIESSRAVVVHILLAARVPLAFPDIFSANPNWPLDALSVVVSDALLSAGVAVESATCLPPSTLSETLYRCTGPGMAEMDAWVRLGKQHYGLESVYLSVQAPGLAELVGVTAAQEELLLAPTLSFVEPEEALAQACAVVCNMNGVAFKGTHGTALQTSEALH